MRLSTGTHLCWLNPALDGEGGVWGFSFFFFLFDRDS